MSGDPVLLSIEDGVARVELARPPVNALDIGLVEALRATVRELPARDPRAVVFSGGSRTLAAGGDVHWMLDRALARDDHAISGFLRKIQGLFDDIERLPCATIAIVRGPTLGGGFELALACDLRVAADDARVGFPEATLGLLPGAGGTQRLTEIVGRGLALELLYTGRVLPAADAAQLGLINRVAPADDVDAAVDDLMTAVLASTREARAAIKACVVANVVDGRPAGLRAESAGTKELLLGAPAIERMQEFQRARERKAAARQPELQGA